MAEPIIEFKDEAQAHECMKEWQTRLFLDDWIVRLAILDQHEMPESDCDGYNHRFNTTKACKISIARKAKDDAACLVKHCEELVLVHELLHCKPWLTHYAENQGAMAGCFVEQHEHTMLDQMAKSLIMAKYNVTFDWFKNF